MLCFFQYFLFKFSAAAAHEMQEKAANQKKEDTASLGGGEDVTLPDLCTSRYEDSLPPKTLSRH